MDERIAVLERRLRRVQVIGGVALVACLASSALAYFAPGKKSEGVVRAGAFVLVDERGATVATLASEPNGPLLRFRSKATESDLLVGGFGPNIGLFILDDRKQVRAMWAAGKKGGGPAMTFSDGRGRTRVMVGTEDDGDGGNPVCS